MTIEELLQKASPTPWKFADKWTDADKGEYGEKESKALRKIKHNKQLSDHCVNNFMKLVEALEESRNLLNYIATTPKAWETIHGRALDTRIVVDEALTDAKTLIDITSNPA